MTYLQRLVRWADRRFMRLFNRLDAIADYQTIGEFHALPLKTKARCIALVLRLLPYAFLVYILIKLRPTLQEELSV